MDTNSVLLSKYEYDLLKTKQLQLESLLNHESSKVITVHIPAYDYTIRPPQVLKNIDVPKTIETNLAVMVDRLHSKSQQVILRDKTIAQLEKQIANQLPWYLAATKAILVGLIAGTSMHLLLNIF